jgi:hypothetical protein
MGREATCHCKWGLESAECKVLLEVSEFIVRGAIRRRVPIASLTEISVDEDQLRFRAGEDLVSLNLGADQARRWAKAMTSSPPSLATKLGISSATRIAILGDSESIELLGAVSEAQRVDDGVASLVLAFVKTVADLNYALDRYRAQSVTAPMWIVYAKGPGKPVTETEIRSLMRHEGFMDTKVAAISATLTALRFSKRGAG